MVKLLYTTYISVDLAHHKIIRVKIDKGGTKINTLGSWCIFYSLHSFKC